VVAQTQSLEVVNGCDTNHLIEKYPCGNVPNCLPGVNNDGNLQLAPEPFAIQLDDGFFPTGDPRGSYNRLLVAHQGTGQVSLIDLSNGPPKSVAYVSNPFFAPDTNGNHGAFGMAEQHRHQPQSTWYLTTNLFPQIDTFQIAEANVIQPQTQISTQSTYAFGNDVRDIQFDADGLRAFVSVNNPPSIITLDTRVLNGATGGLPANAVVSNVDVCQTPSHFAVRRLFLPGAPGEPTQLRTRIYVVCFLSSQVMIVDPDLPDVLATIFSGIGGPNEIAFNFAGDDAAPEDQVVQLLPPRAYVTNFSESTIAVIDLEPGSPSENQVIARLGFPPTGTQP
jgi:hypothetical protein